MNWRLKCIAFHLLEHMPLGKLAHGTLQRLVTGRYFQKLSTGSLVTYNFHVDNFKQRTPGGVALEFGAGRNLLSSLLLSGAGARAVHAFDLQRLATLEQINAILVELRATVGGEWPAVSSFEDLTAKYRIHYHAPGDARNTGLATGSVDFVCSTSTLEHIPPDDIRSILAECRRLLSPRGVMSFIIDYHDHYGTADGNITRWNFYRYDARSWRKYNPPNHYQNRLRHGDHARLFAEAALAAEIDRRVVSDWAVPDLARSEICADFANYSRDDLVTSNGHFVLRSATATTP
jgi:SAM-dependent methyltransferase